MPDQEILDTPEAQTLVQLLEEATRSTPEGVRRFVEPASGTLIRATSRQHHLVFGRRGSGKSSLLRKAASDLTVDRRPIAFVDLETFKGHTYPDVLLSILIETFSKFAEWLETAAIAPANKTSFWARLFGKKPTRPPFDKATAKNLSVDLRASVADLRELLFSEDERNVSLTRSTKETSGGATKGELSLGVESVKVGMSDEVTNSSEAADQQTESYKVSKLQHLHQHILDYKSLFSRMRALSGGDAFLFLDDLYHIRRRDQAHVIDYFHRIGKGNGLWMKVGTIRHRTDWYIHGDPPIGMKIGDDIDEIDLDLTLEKYNLTKGFLDKVLHGFLEESKLNREDILTDGALDRLVLASGGVARDFLGILRGSIHIARERGHTARGPKIGVEDVNGAAGEYDSKKREELRRDTLDERQRLEEAFGDIGKFVKNSSNANVFLMDRGLPDAEADPIEELVDLRLVHRVRNRVTVVHRPGKVFQAFMLDVSQYTAARKKRELHIIEFWRDDATDAIRLPKLIYKEMHEGKVVTKQIEEE